MITREYVITQFKEFGSVYAFSQELVEFMKWIHEDLHVIYFKIQMRGIDTWLIERM